jgi:hypothetical protein
LHGRPLLLVLLVLLLLLNLLRLRRLRRKGAAAVPPVFRVAEGPVRGMLSRVVVVAGLFFTISHVTTRLVGGGYGATGSHVAT